MHEPLAPMYYIRIPQWLTIEEMEAQTLEVVEHNVRLLQPQEDVWIIQSGLTRAST